MRRYGLIGKNLSHTFSPGYFKKKFETENILDASYSIFDLENIEDIKMLFEDGINGFNVTIPYKETIIPFLDSIDEAAAEIGAVNCVKKTKNGFKGYNTDAYGFRISLENTIEVHSINQAIILGDGGAAKAVKYVLKELQIPYFVVTRNGAFNYEDITDYLIDNVSLIVNTTPLGMYPEIDTFPDLPYESINNHHLLFDLIYNPEKTLFLKKGEERGALIKNGYEMLTLQADNSWQIWNQI